MKAERSPTADEQAGIDWWNGVTEATRAHWLKVANTAVPAEAWARFKEGDGATANAIVLGDDA